MLRGSLTDLLSLDTPLPIGSELQQLSAERKTAISSMNLLRSYCHDVFADKFF